MEHQSWIGGGAALLSSLAWAVSVTIYRKFGTQASGNQINLLKNSIASVCFAVFFLFVPGQWLISSDDWLALILSGLAGFALADSALLASIKKINATVPSALQCLMVPAATWLAFMFHDEALTRNELLGTIWILIGVFGVIWASRSPGQGPSVPNPQLLAGLILAIISVIGQACGWALAKSALQRVGFIEAAAIRLAITIPVLASVVYLRGEGRAFVQLLKPGRPTVFLATAGITGTFMGLVLATLAAKFTKLGIVTALLTTTPIFTVPLAYFFQREKTSPRVLAFVVLTVMGVFVMLLF